MLPAFAVGFGAGAGLIAYSVYHRYTVFSRDPDETDLDHLWWTLNGFAWHRILALLVLMGMATVVVVHGLDDIFAVVIG